MPIALPEQSGELYHAKVPPGRDQPPPKSSEPPEKVVQPTPTPAGVEAVEESYAHVMARLHTNPPALLFAHCAHEGVHSVQPAARSAADDSGHGAVADARPTDWFHTSFADAGDVNASPAPAMSTPAAAIAASRREGIAMVVSPFVGRP